LSFSFDGLCFECFFDFLFFDAPAFLEKRTAFVDLRPLFISDTIFLRPFGLLNFFGGFINSFPLESSITRPIRLCSFFNGTGFQIPDEEETVDHDEDNESDLVAAINEDMELDDDEDELDEDELDEDELDEDELDEDELDEDELEEDELEDEDDDEDDLEDEDEYTTYDKVCFFLPLSFLLFLFFCALIAIPSPNGSSSRKEFSIGYFTGPVRVDFPSETNSQDKLLRRPF